jgi:hypothetical protein
MIQIAETAQNAFRIELLGPMTFHRLEQSSDLSIDVGRALALMNAEGPAQRPHGLPHRQADPVETGQLGKASYAGGTCRGLRPWQQVGAADQPRVPSRSCDPVSRRITGRY